MVARNVEWYYFKGKASWARVQLPDLEFKNWNIRVYLTPESLVEFNKLKEPKGDVEGILNEVKQDDEGSYITLKRPMFKNWGKGDEPLTPPEVIDANNQPIPNSTLIGNGSDVTVKVECYKYRKPFNKGQGRAIRLVGVKVEHMIPYSRKDFSAHQEHAIAGLVDQEVRTT